ncbi:hypothetical protein EW145_g2384 [Phellinidium pouzarii]|uniref:F-box domain-containing protein n=1 Tax=Phellinidium pouzarii TaxID=167371 RepID=A0A4S4LGI7_9AGAM|nr:hypothetical protein EW145_g2384 [Phellinidium pouzarii]
MNDNGFIALQEIIGLLSKHARRLRSLLRVYPQILHDAHDYDDLPLLEELFVVNPPDGEFHIFPVINLPPKLKGLSLLNTYAHFTPATQWPQLQHLEIWQADAGFAGLSVHDCLKILSQLPSLCSLGVHISVDDDETAPRGPSEVVLPALRCLVISSSVEHDLGDLLSALSTPALEATGFDGCAALTFYPKLERFLQQCASTLRLLALGQASVNLQLFGALALFPPSARVILCGSSFDGHAAARIGQSKRDNVYDSCWSHMLSLAYLSNDMWSDTHENKEPYSYLVQEWYINLWRPASQEINDNQPQSVQVLICKGASMGHASFVETWIS